VQVGERWPRGRTARFVANAGARIAQHEHAPGRFTTVASWLAAPRRTVTLDLLRRALAAPASTAEHATPAPLQTDSEPRSIIRLLAAYRRLLTAPREVPQSEHLAEVVRAMDSVREDSAFAAWIVRRAMALGVSGRELGSGAVTGVVGSGVLRDRWLDGLESEIATIIAASGASTAALPDSATTMRLREHAYQARLQRLEDACDELARRTEEKIDLSEIDEWCALEEIRGVIREAWPDADPAACATLFRAAYAPVCDHAVRLCNVRGRRYTAAVAFEWLAKLARLSGGSEHERGLLEKNVRACDGDRFLFEDEIDGEPLGTQPKTLDPAAVKLLFVVTAVAVVTPIRVQLADGRPGAWQIVAIAGVALTAALVAMRWWSRFFWGYLTDDGLLVQRREGRWNVPYDDIVYVRALPRLGAVSVRLRRFPDWLGRTVRIAAASKDDALSIASRIQERMNEVLAR
jgi:hypothetical protein